MSDYKRNCVAPLGSLNFRQKVKALDKLIQEKERILLLTPPQCLGEMLKNYNSTHGFNIRMSHWCRKDRIVSLVTVGEFFNPQ